MKNRKTIRIILIAAAVLAFTGSVFTGCVKIDDPESKPKVTYPRFVAVFKDHERYTENELYVWNSDTDRKVHCIEIIPKGLAANEKIPFVVYVHGGNGSSVSLITEPEWLASYKIGGITFECCGGNKVTPMSDTTGLKDSPHTTCRASDLEAVLAYAKTLDCVDVSRIYIYGQSAGGSVVMSSAPRHNADVKGMIIESSGLNENSNPAAVPENRDACGYLEKYAPPQDWRTYYKSYTGDIIICCSEGDTGAHAAGMYTEAFYNDRTAGTCRFYSCPEGAHAFNSFSEEGKEITLNAIKDMILGA